MSSLGARTALVAAALVVLIAVGAAPVAAVDGDPPLEEVVLADAPPQFVESPEGTPGTGRISPEEFFALNGESLPDDLDPDAFEVFIRRWDDEETLQSIFVILARFPQVADAQGFYRGATEAAEDAESGVESSFDPGLEDSTGYVQTAEDVRLATVVSTKGRYSFSLVLSGPADGDPPDQQTLVDLARRQTDAIPETAGVTETTTTDDGSTTESASYRAGRVVGQLLILGLVIAAVVALVRRSRRPATPAAAPPAAAPPGWYADPELASAERYWDGGQWTERRDRSAT